MIKEQEPKYTAHLVDGDCKIVNRKTANRIPDNEPVFIFRAKDKYSVYALESYIQKMIDAGDVSDDHINAVKARLDDFLEFHNNQILNTPNT